MYISLCKPSSLRESVSYVRLSNLFAWLSQWVAPRSERCLYVLFWISEMLTYTTAQLLLGGVSRIYFVWLRIILGLGERVCACRMTYPSFSLLLADLADGFGLDRLHGGHLGLDVLGRGSVVWVYVVFIPVFVCSCPCDCDLSFCLPVPIWLLQREA